MIHRAEKALGLTLLGCALAFNAVTLAPEPRIGRVPLNDAVLHLAAAERLADSFSRGEPFLDPWVSEWSLGYPVWRSYQPLPHLLAAGVLALARGEAAHPVVRGAAVRASRAVASERLRRAEAPRLAPRGSRARGVPRARA